MKLHENRQLFSDAINAASQPINEGGLGIKSIFIEKDYWICRSLQMMSKGDSDHKAVFKGGTSLSKAYGIGSRFSEDIDVAIADAWTLSGNQLKKLIRQTAKNMTEGLDEINIPGITSKGSHYHKAFYAYPRTIETVQVGAIKAGQILVEINSFANPSPTQERIIESFLTDFLTKTNNENLIEEYEMQPFTISVLDKRRTLTEKLVSLLRCSLAKDPVPQLNAKIRHFYDLFFLYQDPTVNDYIHSEIFHSDLECLFKHDQQEFKNPNGWQDRTMQDSPLLTDFHIIWVELQSLYLRELPDLAYQQIPSVEEIESSIKSILTLIK